MRSRRSRWRGSASKGYAKLKRLLLATAARGALPGDRLSDLLDRARAARRLTEQLEKSARHLELLRGPKSDSRAPA